MRERRCGGRFVDGMKGSTIRTGSTRARAVQYGARQPPNWGTIATASPVAPSVAPP